MKKNGAIIIIIAVIAIGIIFYVFLTAGRKTVTPVTIGGDRITEDEKDVLIVEETIMDCVAIVDDYERGFCLQNLLDVFTVNLEECQPSIGTTFIGWEAMLGMFRKYEIKGVENGKCVVQFEIGFMDPMTMELLDWDEMKQKLMEEAGIKEEEAEVFINPLSEQMICEYGPEEKTIQHVADGEGCYGLLYDGLNKLMGLLQSLWN